MSYNERNHETAYETLCIIVARSVELPTTESHLGLGVGGVPSATESFLFCRVSREPVDKHKPVDGVRQKEPVPKQHNVEALLLFRSYNNI